MTGSIKLIIELKNMMERDIISLENKLEEKKEMFEKLNQIIEKKCKHKWIADYIDTSPDTSQIIEYCSKCMITKN
tara:strand:+ start:2316 stop:2540 length:225 start_codon:yes stop_codon:yes gene_type:complete